MSVEKPPSVWDRIKIKLYEIFFYVDDISNPIVADTEKNIAGVKIAATLGAIALIGLSTIWIYRKRRNDISLKSEER